MRAASITIQAIAFTALFAVYAQGHFEGSGVRRALQTIGTTVGVSAALPATADQA